nr:hypothetical protein [Tanacetum cinerariifolium]
MFDEYLEPPRVDIPVSLALRVPVLINSAGTPSSTTIDQDEPSLSNSSSYLVLQYLCLHQDVAAKSTLMDENLFGPNDNNPFINIFCLKPTSETSSSKVRGFCWEGVGIHGRSSGKWWSGVKMGKNCVVRGGGKNGLQEGVGIHGRSSGKWWSG